MSLRDLHDSRARSGDLVSARVADRDAVPIEGILHLRYVPELHYVQVNVLTSDNEITVDATTVKVIEGGVVGPEEVGRDDPLPAFPGRHPVYDLGKAVEGGLVPAVPAYCGVTWDEYLRRANRLLEPLLSSGWFITDQHEEVSCGPPDTVMTSLERDGVLIEVEYYEGGGAVVYPGGGERQVSPDDDVTAPLFSADTDEHVQQEFVARGWVGASPKIQPS